MENANLQRFDIVILGGGFAGVYAARALLKSLRKAGVSKRVAIIAQENHMVFQPMLPEVAGAALSPRHVVNPIRSLCRGASVYKAEATALDLEKKTIKLHAGTFVGELEITFEQIVICLGARIDLSRIPGMQEHALLMQNAGDAMRLRAAVISRFEEANLAADPDLKRRLLSFVIVGGGYSGVETAGQLIDLGKAMCPYFRNIEYADCRFTLVHSRDHLLPTLHESLGRYTAEKLRERGLKILLNTRAKAVTANRLYLAEGDPVEANTIVCTIGNAPHALIESIASFPGVEIESGRVKVQADCSAAKIPWLWSAGDCAAIPYANGGYCPPTAQFAFRQGELMGKNIAAKILGKPTKPFLFKNIGELAAIGHQTAVAEIKGRRFSGFIAWFMWRTIYLSKLPGLERKLRVAFDWSLELFFPRDINLLNPRYSSELSETYLEPGDILFHAGDPAFSFYIVKSGSINLFDGDKLVKTIAAGQHFGERALLDDAPFRLTAVAAEPTELVALTGDAFSKVVQYDTGFSEYLQQSAKTFLTRDELDRLLERIPNPTLDRPVSEIMTRNPICFSCQSPIGDALAALKKRSRNYLPILDPDARPVGALRKETLYRSIQTSDLRLGDRIDTLPLETLPSILESDTVRHALETLATGNATKTLVVDSEGKLQGILALIDILNLDVEALAGERS